MSRFRTSRYDDIDAGIEEDASAPLFLHQKTAVAAMHRLEGGPITKRAASPSRETTSQAVTSQLRTAIGILADKPGAGKSMTMLAHVKAHAKKTKAQGNADATRDTAFPVSSSPLSSPSTSLSCERRFSYYGNNVEKTVFRNFSRIVPTNVFVVPRVTLAQWLRYARELARIPDAEVWACRGQITAEDKDEIESGRRRYVFLTESAYTNYLAVRDKTLLFHRFVLDEADFIYVVKFEPVNAVFTWFMTAAFQSLVHHRARIMSLRSLFSFPDAAAEVWQEFTVRNHDDFVDASLHLPEMHVTTIVTRVPEALHCLRNWGVPDGVVQALNACDVHSAVARLGCVTSTTEDGLVAALTNHFRHEIEVLTQALQRASAAVAATLTDKIVNTETKIHHIHQRVKHAECCPISLDDIRVKAVTPCCQNAFELTNLLRALERSSRCPLCKTALRAEDLLVHFPSGRRPGEEEEGADTVVVAHAGRGLDRRPKSKTEVIRGEIERILGTDPRAKILVFSAFLLDAVRQSVSDATAGSCREVKGSTEQVTRLLNEFSAGNVKALLLSAQHFGSGVNIEAATHVITFHKMEPDRYAQLIGRAQRPGRTTSLHVVNLRYENEDTA